MAYNFYNACCGCTGVTACFVVEKTREWNCEWHCSRSKRHIAEYYNVLFKKLYHFNGSIKSTGTRVSGAITAVWDRRHDPPTQVSAQD